MKPNQENPYVRGILAHEDELRAEAKNSEQLGQVSPRTAEIMRALGLMRMLQNREFGGHEVDPITFLEATFTLASIQGAAGWVSGVVGLHPWEISQLSEEVQREVWGENPDTWISSPYAPIGRGIDAEGGQVVSGRWPFGSGTDHCEWALLGGMAKDRPGEILHYLIPKADYAIDQESWDVNGLRGTGSKDIVVSAAFVPNHRIIVADSISHGNADPKWEQTAPLYRMPFWVLFPAAIATATLGIAQGAVNAYQRSVIETAKQRGKLTQSPAQLSALGVASAEVDASFITVLDGVKRSFEAVAAGQSVTMQDRLETRRDQTVAVRRCFDAVYALYKEAGSLGIRASTEFSRFFRDLAVGAEHHSNTPESYLAAYASTLLGEPIPGDIRIGPAPTRDSL